MSGDGFDPRVAGPRLRRIPEGDDRERLVCPECDYVAYENPKVVVGSVCTLERDGVELFLLCRRAIEPRRGFWTLPAGFMEVRETSREGAAREAWEEARARIEVGALLAVYEIVRLSQVQLFYRSRLLHDGEGVEPGYESLEVQLFRWEEIPWEEIAFPTVRWALERHREVGDAQPFEVASNPAGETPDMPSD